MFLPLETILRRRRNIREDFRRDKKMKNETLRPLEGFVIIKVLRYEQTGLLIIKEAIPWYRGEIIGVGSGVASLLIGDIVRYQSVKSKASIFIWQNDVCMCLHSEQVFSIHYFDDNVYRVLSDYVYLKYLNSHPLESRIIQLPTTFKSDVCAAEVRMFGPEVSGLQKGDVVLYESSPHWQMYRQSGEWLFFTKFVNLLAVNR